MERSIFRSAALGATLVAVALATGCGSSPPSSDASTTAPMPTAATHEFPDPDGKTLIELRKDLGPGGPILAPSMSVLEPGETNRFGFGLFDRSRRQITGADVAVYAARVGGGPVLGPFPAQSESLAVKPQFQSAGTEADPDAAQSVYVAQIPIKRPGDYEFIGAVDLDGRIVAADPASPPLSADPKNPVPDVGEAPPRVSTPTYQSVGGNLAEIDTRVPTARELHAEDFADVLGTRPAVLLFATPALCQSRVCGPVVDELLEVASTAPDDIAFIHQEIFKNNTLEDGFRPQVGAFGLETEPWAFVVGADGKIESRFEGAFSARELQEAIAPLSSGRP